MKTKFFQIEGRAPGEWFFQCPGCECLHYVDSPRWTFNGDVNNPTVSPSLVVEHSDNVRCHLFIKNGYLEFLSDSTHALAGQLSKFQIGRINYVVQLLRKSFSQC